MKNETRIFINACLLGVMIGGIACGLLVDHFAGEQMKAHDAQIWQSRRHTDQQFDGNMKIEQQIADTWKQRAESCEAKFRVGTIVYEKQDIASVPLFHGAASINIGGVVVRPYLYIPEQVDIYTDRPDVRYEWRDGKSGESKGIQLPHPLPAAVQK
jgi:hypothetical protein